MTATNGQYSTPYATPMPAMTATQQDAFSKLRGMLTGYGLDSLVGGAANLFLDGKTDTEIQLWLEEQTIVKQKFAAVFERRKAGKPPISFKDVIDYQARANELESMYGIPSGFIDVNKLMVEDVSPNELNSRLGIAADYVTARPDVTEQFRIQHGLGDGIGAAIAAFVDPAKATPMLTQEWQSAKVSAEAKRAGFGALSLDEAMSLVQSGVSDQGAAKGFAQLANDKELMAPLAGEDLSTFTRDQQIAIAGGVHPELIRELDRRRRERVSIFDEGGSLATTSGGIIGAGAAAR